MHSVSFTSDSIYSYSREGGWDVYRAGIVSNGEWYEMGGDEGSDECEMRATPSSLTLLPTSLTIYDLRVDPTYLPGVSDFKSGTPLIVLPREDSYRILANFLSSTPDCFSFTLACPDSHVEGIDPDLGGRFSYALRVTELATRPNQLLKLSHIGSASLHSDDLDLPTLDNGNLPEDEEDEEEDAWEDNDAAMHECCAEIYAQEEEEVRLIAEACDEVKNLTEDEEKAGIIAHKKSTLHHGEATPIPRIFGRGRRRRRHRKGRAIMIWWTKTGPRGLDHPPSPVYSNYVCLGWLYTTGIQNERYNSTYISYVAPYHGPQREQRDCVVRASDLGIESVISGEAEIKPNLAWLANSA
ncbi:hypothetical protein BDZ89DRAFT_1046057 [Hymenopellis radicata]|nr:hypothetical protein BDZ89DRAFT_1046057 [Hymenopellis radicata]